MENQKELRLLGKGSFDAYLDFVCAELGLSSRASVPEGTGEFATNKGLASFAVSRAEAFAAFQWFDISGAAPHVIESFLVTPQSIAARSGLRLRPMLEPVSGSDAQRPLAEAWRAAVGGEDAGKTASFPAFIELACILASRGGAPVANSELLEHTRTLESEIEHLRVMLLEQSDHLPTAKDNLRHVTLAPWPLRHSLVLRR